MTHTVTDNAEKSRFELVEDGHLAYADYRRDGKTLYINYVFSPPELRGKGTAGRLMEGVVSAAKGAGLDIHPICGYAAAWLRKQKEHHDRQS